MTFNGFISRSIASVSSVGEVVKVRHELAKIRQIMRTVTKTALWIPFHVTFIIQKCQIGSPAP